MKKSLVTLAIVAMGFACVRCQPAAEADPCDQELAQVEARCEAGFGLADGDRLYVLCLNGDPSRNLLSNHGAAMMEKIEAGLQQQGLDGAGEWGELIQIGRECRCLDDEPGQPRIHACSIASKTAWGE